MKKVNTKKMISLMLEYLWNEYEKNIDYKIMKFETYCKSKGIDSEKLLQMENGQLKIDKNYVESCRYKMI